MIPSEELTIIVPAHNIAGYLEACLTSIRDNGGQACRLIVVDDGSSDLPEASRQHLAGVFGGDLRWIRIAHAGAGAARNAGLSVVDTPWVTFVDGDDVMVHQGLAALREAAEPAVDIVFSNMMISWNLPKRVEQLTEFVARDRVPVAELPVERRLSGAGKMFRTEFLRAHAITFPEGMVWEDVVFSHRTYRHAHRVSSIPTMTYFWLKRPAGGSVTQAPLNPKTVRDRFRQVEMSVAISRTPEWLANFGRSFEFAPMLRQRLAPVFRAMRQPEKQAQAMAALAVIREECEPHWALLAAGPDAARLLFEHVRALDLDGIRALSA